MKITKDQFLAGVVAVFLFWLCLEVVGAGIGMVTAVVTEPDLSQYGITDQELATSRACQKLAYQVLATDSSNKSLLIENSEKYMQCMADNTP